MSFILSHHTIAYILNLTDITYEILQNGNEVTFKMNGSAGQLNGFCKVSIIDTLKTSFKAEKLNSSTVKFYNDKSYEELRRCIEDIFVQTDVSVPKVFLKRHYETIRPVYKLEDFKTMHIN